MEAETNFDSLYRRCRDPEMAPDCSNNLKCSHCEKIIKENSPSISCCVCLSWFHKGCSELTAREFNRQVTLWKKSGETTWTCNSCQSSSIVDPRAGPTSSRNRLSIGPGATITSPKNISDDNDIGRQNDNQVSLRDIMDKLIGMESRYLDLLGKYDEQVRINADLRSEIAEIKRQLLVNNEGTVGKHRMADDLVGESVREFSERQSRQKNLLIFGANENNSPDGQSRKDSDTALATDVILKAYPDVKLQDVKVFRIGRQDPLKKRPIKVVLGSANDVSAIIRHANQLKKLDQYKQYSLSFDRTPKQIAEYKALKETLLLRSQKGENNLKIKYIGGIPKIVTLN